MKYSVAVECNFSVEIEIPDGLTSHEIDEFAEKEVKECLPTNVDDWFYDFEYRRPKGIDEFPEPPESFWVTIDKFTVVTNGHLILLKNCPIRPDFQVSWLKKDASAFIKIFDSDYKSLPLHLGWFQAKYAKPFEKLGVKVLGKDKISPGYIFWENQLIAVLMPCETKNNNLNLESLMQFAVHKKLGV